MRQIVEALRARNAKPGQTMTEYALILATIAAVLIALFNSSGAIIQTLVDHVGPLL